MSHRIALISEHASPLAVLGGVDAGGQNVYVAQVARGLARLGHRVDVYTRRDDPDLETVVEWGSRIRVIHVPAGPAEPTPKERLLPWMPDFRDWMRRHWIHEGRHYDLLHANFFMSGLVAADLKAATGIPYVVTFHALGAIRRRFQGPDDGFPAERVDIEARVAREADRVIAECPQDREDLVSLYNADPDRIAIVPCGFDPAEFGPRDRAAARAELGLEPDVPVVLQLGRIVRRKGVDTVIEAIGRVVHEHGENVRLLVVGGAEREPDPTRDPELGRLMTLANEAGVGDHVTFVGRRDRAELATFYAAADTFVSTPWYEPFGITPLEAMACGTPVIGSAVGGIRSTVRDGVTGFLVPPKDPAAVAEAIVRIVRDPALRDRLGRAGIQRVNERFTWTRVVEELTGIYENVIDEHRRAAREPARRRVALPTPTRPTTGAAAGRSLPTPAARTAAGALGIRR